MPEQLRRFGRYIELKSLATGGMGEILLAEHTGLSGFAKRVAVKRIRPAVAREPQYVDLFLNEARIGSFLNHPNIVHIFDVGREGDDLWLVMEYVEGVDLKRLARRARRAGRPLQGPIIAAIAVEVLSALEEAHHGGPLGGAPIIHRDLSPENILIAKSGGIKVLDFGLAKWMPNRNSVDSIEGDMIFGKVRYMPPEQLRGQKIDPRADLFALGATLYETLRGDLPFGRGSADEVLANILSGPPPSPTEAVEFDEDLDTLIFRAISADREDRFANAKEMRSAFVRYLEKKPSPRLPLDALRQMLHREGPLDNPSSEDARPTELALPVPERCGKCGGDFVAAFVEDMIVDCCSQCGGMWLERDEVLRLVGPGCDFSTGTAPEPIKPHPLDSLTGSCPVDKIALNRYKVPNHPASLEVCTHCSGVWFDKDEVQLLRSGGVGTWLRYLLDTLQKPDG